MRRILLLPALLAACDGDPFLSGAGEPIVVTDADADFHEGRLPSNDDGPGIVFVSSVGGIVSLGQGDIGYTGLATKDAFSVGIQFPGVGDGFWVVPVDGPDVTQDNQLLFGMNVDFRPEVPYGIQELAFVAFDAKGHGGPRFTSEICILPVPDVAAGLFACDDATTPQNAIVSLEWDTPVDLDLVVITPEGKVVTAKQPSSVITTGPLDPALRDPGTGFLTRDSNADCHIDGIQLESLVFPEAPAAGEYLVYARLHQACGVPTVRYRADLLRRVDADDGSHPVETTLLGGGTLLSSQASRGDALGTLIATVVL